MLSSTEIFSENGLLKQAIEGYTPRTSQLLMAETIERVIAKDASLIVEAGTGTGKTFAYLVPIFLAQKKTIISTGTKNLQDQLFFKDIPIIKTILGATQKVVLLKGRANYLCLYRLQNSYQDGRFVSQELTSHLQKIYEWSSCTQKGDIAELISVPEDSGIWPHVTSHAENCLNQECPFYKDCHVVNVRQQALAADIVIVNHHLFFADLALQEGGFGELLPEAKVIIFDEAHHLPDIASQFFSTSITARQLNEFAGDVEIEIAQNAKDMTAINEIGQCLQDAVYDMKMNLGPDSKRAPWPENLPKKLAENVEKIKLNLQQMEEILKQIGVRSKGLESCARRCTELIERFNFLTSATPEDMIHWYETFKQSFVVQLTPMIVAEYFNKFLAGKNRSWVFTSATLTVKNSFHLFRETMGLDQCLTLQLKSPFDYQEQALLYLPRGLPDPRASTHVEKIIEVALPLLEITQGKTFFLFTSHKAMEYAAALLKNRTSYPLLLQGTAPKRELIDQFKNLGNAVLLGTSSFWYGVDVRGKALSCVIIDKLPFAPPEDPILQARIRMLRKKGIDPFLNYQLPQAVLILKQGVGRLIRDTTDRGILVICDPRLMGNRYGETFLQSLPEMRRTREINKVKNFFEQG